MNIAAREALKVACSKLSTEGYHPGCIDGRIACYGATTIPMAQFAKTIQNDQKMNGYENCVYRMSNVLPSKT